MKRVNLIALGERRVGESIADVNQESIRVIPKILDIYRKFQKFPPGFNAK